MKILNKNNIEIKNPDLKKGEVTKDKILITHHEATPEIKEKFHYETIKEYSTGAKDVKRVIDIPYQAARDAWDEYEDILRYTEYTPEELEEINAPTPLDKMKELEAKNDELQKRIESFEISYREGVENA